MVERSDTTGNRPSFPLIPEGSKKFWRPSGVRPLRIFSGGVAHSGRSTTGYAAGKPPAWRGISKPMFVHGG